MIFLLTDLCSVKPQRKKKPKSQKHTKVIHCSLKNFILKFLRDSAFQEYYQTLSSGSINKRKTSSFI